MVEILNTIFAIATARLIWEKTNHQAVPNQAATLSIGEIARAMGYTAGKDRAIDPVITQRIASDVFLLNRVVTWAADGPNMISVGVDVPRLGLMVCSGQPKTTAEYIQATSRVGRDAAGPGLVVTLYNWARPRDLSHYETFEHYHQTYYRQVEALSVTPFARRAMDRGLTALLVSETRHSRAEWNPKPAAQIVPVLRTDFDPIAASLRERAELVANKAAASAVDELVADRRDKWSKQQAAPGVTLAYARGTGSEINLLKAAETGPWTVFTVPNSLREVEVGSNLLLREDDPSDDPAADFLQPPLPVVNGEVEADAGLTVEAAAGDADEVDDADVQLDPDEAVL